MRLIGLAFEGRHRPRGSLAGSRSATRISILGDELAFDVEIGWESADQILIEQAERDHMMCAIFRPCRETFGEGSDVIRGH